MVSPKVVQVVDLYVLELEICKQMSVHGCYKGVDVITNDVVGGTEDVSTRLRFHIFSSSGQN